MLLIEFVGLRSGVSRKRLRWKKGKCLLVGCSTNSTQHAKLLLPWKKKTHGDIDHKRRGHGRIAVFSSFQRLYRLFFLIKLVLSLTMATAHPMEPQIRALALEFIDLASNYFHGTLDRRLSSKTVSRRFISHFGVTPRHCALVWIYCKERVHHCEKKHLLWVLHLLKTDATEHDLNGRWRADEKTIRKWVYLFLEVLSDLEVVSFHYCCCFRYRLANVFFSTDQMGVSERRREDQLQGLRLH